MWLWTGLNRVSLDVTLLSASSGGFGDLIDNWITPSMVKKRLDHMVPSGSN